MTGTTPAEWNSVITMPIQNTKLKRYSTKFLDQTQFGFRKGRPCIDSGITLKVLL